MLYRKSYKEDYTVIAGPLLLIASLFCWFAFGIYQIWFTHVVITCLFFTGLILSWIGWKRNRNVLSPNQAYVLVKKVLQRFPDDPQRPWGLKTFRYGWIVEDQTADHTLIVEKNTGMILRFTKDVKELDIKTNYDCFRLLGHDVTPQ